ncbi:MAG: sulfurtransferase [Rhodobacteraceae bacterium]|nr:sulfurtransferase [Paracoccaceae bacterium]
MLRTSALTLAILALPASLLAAPEGWAPLLEPEGLAELLARDGSIRVVHVSGDFAAGHIPGAAFAAYPEWRGPSDNPGALRELPHFAELLRDLGITADTPVAVVHGGANPTDMGTAARVFWTLRSLGVEDLALVNGGFAAWQAAGLPVSTAPAQITRSGFEPSWSDEWRIDTAEVAELVQSGDARLIDARPLGFFEGRTWSIARPGTIRGADHLTFEQWFDGNRMVDAASARTIAEQAGQTDAPVTVSFCNTGHWAAINWFALSELAGVPNTRLYAESMAEYTAQGLPLDNEPGRLSVILENSRRWVGGLF